MKWSNALWIALLGSALMCGCGDDGDDSGDGGTAGMGATAGSGGSGGMDGTAGNGGVAGTGGTAGTGGLDGDFGVINVDIMQSATNGDDVYVGDDGVLSTPGATFWNAADFFTSVMDADDESGASTPIDFVVNPGGGSIFIGAANNELQDNGLVNLIEDASIGFDFRDLSADGAYDLAIYIYAETALATFTTLDVTSASGVTSVGPSEEPTWILPGEEGKDYFLLENLSPYEITPDVYGLRVSNINAEGAILGAQLARVD